MSEIYVKTCENCTSTIKQVTDGDRVCDVIEWNLCDKCMADLKDTLAGFRPRQWSRSTSGSQRITGVSTDE